MLIIPEDILFKHVISSNVQYVGDRNPYHQMGDFPVLMYLIGLITSTDFN